MERAPPWRRSSSAAGSSLLEHSTGAVNWQPRNLAKAPGEMRRNSLSHVARGDHRYLFLINHGDADATVAASGRDLLTDSDHAGEIVVPAGGVRVIRA